MRGLRTATSFLTRVPTGIGEVSDERLGRSVPWFGVVGALVGLVVAGVYIGASAIAPPLLAAALAVAAGVVVTGGFHEDGLADVADALGGSDPESSRRILKDPRLGTYGVLALVLGVAIRIAAVSGLDAWTALAAIPAAHVLARSAAVAPMTSARMSAPGLGASYMGALRRRDAFAGLALGAALAALAVGTWAVVGIVAVMVPAVGISALATRRFGGLSGDVLGAIEQLGEVLLLALAATAVASGWTVWWR